MNPILTYHNQLAGVSYGYSECNWTLDGYQGVSMNSSITLIILSVIIGIIAAYGMPIHMQVFVGVMSAIAALSYIRDLVDATIVRKHKKMYLQFLKDIEASRANNAFGPLSEFIEKE